MAGRTFVDTNVLVYLFDSGEAERQGRARRALEWMEMGDLVVSTQVLQEFYATVTRKRLLTLEGAARAVASLAKNPCVVVTPPLILAAASRGVRTQMGFWDALIVEAALSGGCERLLTEDKGLQPGSTVDGLRVENPFRGA